MQKTHQHRRYCSSRRSRGRWSRRDRMIRSLGDTVHTRQHVRLLPVPHMIQVRAPPLARPRHLRWILQVAAAPSRKHRYAFARAHRTAFAYRCENFHTIANGHIADLAELSQPISKMQTIATRQVSRATVGKCTAYPLASAWTLHLRLTQCVCCSTFAARASKRVSSVRGEFAASDFQQECNPGNRRLTPSKYVCPTQLSARPLPPSRLSRRSLPRLLPCPL